MENPKIKIVNMIMIYDKDKCVVLDRAASDWGGLTFPGGHVEPGESFYQSAVREAKEETGLSVKNLTPCGVVHWAHRESGKRYIEFLYKTCDYSGELTKATREGRVFWMDKKELAASDKLSMNFSLYLPIFFGDKYSEMYFDWDGESFEAEPLYL